MKLLKIILVIAISCITSLGAISNPLVKKIRAEFYEIVKDSKRTPEVLAEIRSIENPNAIIKAYEAASEAMMARVVWNPFSKIKHVRRSQELFEEALGMDSLNVEVRFIRFAVEYNIPKWLGYSKHMQDDKDYIMINLDQFDLTCISADMLDYIKSFLKKSGWYSEQELEEIYALSAE